MSYNAELAKFEARPCKACETLRKSLQLPYRALAALYAYVFARPWGQPFNDVILQFALRGRGYKNCCDPKSTGEAIFIDLLASTAPRLCIDVGANKGEYSQTLLARTKSTVIAFEPLPKAFETLSKLKAAYPERFDALNVGVGAKEDTLQLHYGSDDSKLASFSSETSQIAYVGSRNVNVMNVPVITLDSYFEKHIHGKFDALDLLKIDTEGFEYEVLLGAQRTIARLRPKFIQLEYNWHQLFRATSLKRLSELMPGYTPYQLLPYGSGLVKRDVNRPESNIFHYSNFVFVREGVSLH